MINIPLRWLSIPIAANFNGVSTPTAYIGASSHVTREVRFESANDGRERGVQTPCNSRNPSDFAHAGVRSGGSVRSSAVNVQPVSRIDPKQLIANGS